MKKILLLLVALTFVVSPVCAAEFTLKGSVAVSTAVPVGKVAEFFSNTIAEKSNGQIKTKFYPGGQLGGEVELLSQLKDGVVDWILISSAITAQYNPKFDLMFMPYYVPSWESFKEFVNTKASEELLGELNNQGISGLAWAPMGYYDLLWKGQPIRTLEDCKGKKFRSAESQILLSTLKSYGLNATPIPFPEVYQSLQTNVVTGTNLPPWVIKLAKFDEVLTGGTLTHDIFGAGVILFNNKSLNKLPKDLQAMVRATAKEAGQMSTDLHQESEKTAYAELEKSGFQVVRLNDNEQAKFKKATNSVVVEYEKRIDEYSNDGREYMRKMYKAFGRDYDKEFYGQ